MKIKELLSRIKSSSHPSESEVQVVMTHAEERRFKLEGIRVTIGAVLIDLVLGCFYLWGGISLYVASYLRASDPTLSIDTVKLVFPFMNIALCIGMPFGVRLADKIGAKLLSFLGICLISLITFLTSFINNFLGYLILYGLGVGLISGMLYVVAYSFGWKYFPEHKGTVSGVVLAGYGFGSLIWNFIALSCVNPENLKAHIKYENDSYFGPEVYQNVPYMMRILALCYLLVGNLGVILVKTPKKIPLSHHSIEQHPLDPSAGGSRQIKDIQNHIPAADEAPHLSGEKVSSDHTIDYDHGTHQVSVTECSNLKQGFKSRPFWSLLFMGFFGTFFGYLMANNYKVYGLAKLGDDTFLTTVGSLGSASNGCSRILWASLMDRFGFKKIFFIIICIQLVLSGTLDVIAEVKALFLIWYALIMSCEGGICATEPAAAGKVFGAKYGRLIYGFISFGMTMANLCAFFLTKFGSDALSWSQIFWICFALSGLALLISLTFKQDYRFNHSKANQNNEKEHELTSVVTKL